MKLGILLAALVAPVVAHAADATPKDINDMINTTNFIVANQCSGTLISVKYRLVLTNNHCLEGYLDKVEKEETDEKTGKVEKVTREVYKDMELKQKSYKDFKEVASSAFQAEILFHSEKFDLAILQINADTIPMTFAAHVMPDTKKVSRGQHVFVVGNPLLLDANLNEGVISSVNRTIHWDETNEDVAYYGIDAGVNPGNSGGALYNQDLELIGVPGASARGTGLGFAIPAENIRKFLNDHCYQSVWDDSGSVKDHDSCEQDKVDRVNEIRAKVGLPPLDQPKHDRIGMTSSINQADVVWRPAKPEPGEKKIVTEPAKRPIDLLLEMLKATL